jgi:hypothetical protein
LYFVILFFGIISITVLIHGMNDTELVNLILELLTDFFLGGLTGRSGLVLVFLKCPFEREREIFAVPISSCYSKNNPFVHPLLM